jgi:hypothetical protein
LQAKEKEIEELREELERFRDSKNASLFQNGKTRSERPPLSSQEEPRRELMGLSRTEKVRAKKAWRP